MSKPRKKRKGRRQQQTPMLIQRREVERGWGEELLKGDPCAYCGQRGGTRDHIHPKALHKAIEPADRGKPWFEKVASTYNLTGCCATCNSEKGDMTMLEYMLFRAERNAQKPTADLV